MEENNISNTTTKKLHETLVVPILLYGSEIGMLAAEMTWLRKLLRALKRDKTRNETMRSILQYTSG